MVNKNKIKWKCRRGVLELDTILMNFFDVSLSDLSEKELEVFDVLLTEEDPFLLDWLLYKKESPLQYKNIISKIINN